MKRAVLTFCLILFVLISGCVEEEKGAGGKQQEVQPTKEKEHNIYSDGNLIDCFSVPDVNEKIKAALLEDLNGYLPSLPGELVCQIPEEWEINCGQAFVEGDKTIVSVDIHKFKETSSLSHPFENVIEDLRTLRNQVENYSEKKEMGADLIEFSVLQDPTALWSKGEQIRHLKQYIIPSKKVSISFIGRFISKDELDRLADSLIDKICFSENIDNETFEQKYAECLTQKEALESEYAKCDDLVKECGDELRQCLGEEEAIEANISPNPLDLAKDSTSYLTVTVKNITDSTATNVVVSVQAEAPDSIMIFPSEQTISTLGKGERRILSPFAISPNPQRKVYSGTYVLTVTTTINEQIFTKEIAFELKTGIESPKAKTVEQEYAECLTQKEALDANYVECDNSRKACEYQLQQCLP